MAKALLARRPSRYYVAPPPVDGGGNLIWSDAYIAGLPTTGAAWTRMLGIADAAFSSGAPDLADQDSFTQYSVLANALVYKRTGTASYKTKVVEACLDAIGTHTTPPGGSNPYLGVARTLGDYVVSADLVGMDSSLSRNGSTWLAYCNTMKTANLGSIGGVGPEGLRDQALTDGRNFGAFGRWSYTALAYYTNDSAAIAEAKAAFQRYLGDRTKHVMWGSPTEGASLQPSYIALPASFGSPLSAQSSATRLANWVGIGEQGQVGGLPYDGLITADIPRDSTVYNGNYGGFSSSGVSYSWGVMDAIHATALLFEGAGEDVWNWSSQALKRVNGWLDRAGQYPEPGDTNSYAVPFLANAKYPGSNFPQPANAGRGRALNFTDWLYG